MPGLHPVDSEKRFENADHVAIADFDLAASLSQMLRSKVPYDKYENIMKCFRHLENDIDAWRITGENLINRMNKALSGD